MRLRLVYQIRSDDLCDLISTGADLETGGSEIPFEAELRRYRIANFRANRISGCNLYLALRSALRIPEVHSLHGLQAQFFYFFGRNVPANCAAEAIGCIDHLIGLRLDGGQVVVTRHGLADGIRRHPFK